MGSSPADLGLPLSPHSPQDPHLDITLRPPWAVDLQLPPAGALAEQESSSSLLRKGETAEHRVWLQAPVLVFSVYVTLGKFLYPLKPQFPHL